jgi:MinD superfamily P-loop ATPase
MKQITIVSGKGGTGKTSLLASLAALAKDQAVLVDADVDAPNLALVADPEQIFHQSFTASEKAFVHPERCQQCLACVDACRFDAISLRLDYPYIHTIKCEGCGLCAYLCMIGAIAMEPHNSGFLSASKTRWKSHLYHGKLLPGGENSGKMVTTLREKAERYAHENGIELILIDGAPGIGCPVIASLTGCDLALIVTEPTLSGQHDLERIWKLASHLQVETWVIINKTDLSPENTESIRMFCRERDLPLIAEIPFDEDVVRSMVVGLSIYEFNPYGVFAGQVETIWNGIKTLFNKDRHVAL